MNKLDVKFNKDAKSSWESLNLHYAEGEKNIDEKIKEILFKINIDELPTIGDATQFMIDNLSQEEVLLLAQMFITNEYKLICESVSKKKKTKSPMTKLLKLVKKAEKLKASLLPEKVSTLVATGNSKEDLLQDLRKVAEEKKLIVDFDKLEKCNSIEEMNEELNSQLGGRGWSEVNIRRKPVFKKAEEPQEEKSEKL
jgi:hypothetical protein